MRIDFSAKGIVFLLIGLVVLGYAAYLPLKPKSNVEIVNMPILQNGIVTTGEVTSLQKTMQKDPGQDNDPNASSHLYEIIKVKYSVDGNNFETIGSRVLQNATWEKGEKVKVSYDPSNPRKAVVKENGVPGVEDSSILCLVLMICGIIMVALGFVFSYSRKDSGYP